MKYAVEMRRGAIMYIRTFIKIVSGIHSFCVGGIQRQTDNKEILYAYLYFFRHTGGRK
jgi:hypothetical protein